MIDRQRGTPLARLVLLLAVALILGVGAAAAKPATPGVEVKFFLNPRVVLDANHQPTREVLATFRVADIPKRLRMQFLDGRALELNEAGWNVRLRRLEGKDHLELNYKRRYPVLDHRRDATLLQAARAGFDAGEGDYAAEFEWGFQKETLTFSNEKQVGGATGSDLTLPSAATAQALAVQAMPGKLRRLKQAGWAEGVLSVSRVYGPVEGRRWSGSYPDADKEIDIEVWALPGEGGMGTAHIVEVSFKKKQLDANTATKRDALIRLLKGKGWLLEDDVLKTTLILRSGAGIPADPSPSR